MTKVILFMAGLALLAFFAVSDAPVKAAGGDNDHDGVIVKIDQKGINKHHHHLVFDAQHSKFDNGVEMDIDDGSIFLTHDGHRRDEVEITPDYELMVNGRKVELSDYQQRLVRDYYDLTYGIIDEAMAIGWEGAKIGADGAAVGLFAVANLLKLVSSDYDMDDYERDVERRAAKVEKRADKLEERTDMVEDMADDLESVFDEMFEDIPELKALDWV